MLVEDEVAVRATLSRQIESVGHRAIPASDADAAMQYVSKAGDIDLLVTDVVLGPGMNGIKLASEMRRLRPQLPVVFLSGYAAVPDALEQIHALGATLLPKPVTLSQLEYAIETACRVRVP